MKAKYTENKYTENLSRVTSNKRLKITLNFRAK